MKIELNMNEMPAIIRLDRIMPAYSNLIAKPTNARQNHQPSFDLDL